MQKRYLHRFIIYNLILFMVCCSAISCINKENELEDFIFKTGYAKTGFTIDFNLVDYLNESNKKIIQLSSMAFNQTKDVKTLQLLLKIKRDHRKIDIELKKLAEKNLIIIPQIVYTMEINPDSIKRKNINFYFLNLVRNQIKNQIALLDKIEKSSLSTDFKTLAAKSKKILRCNNDALQMYTSPFCKQKNQLGLR